MPMRIWFVAVMLSLWLPPIVCAGKEKEKTERRQSQRVASQLARSTIPEQEQTSSAPSQSIALNPDEEVLLVRESRQSRSFRSSQAFFVNCDALARCPLSSFPGKTVIFILICLTDMLFLSILELF